MIAIAAHCLPFTSSGRMFAWSMRFALRITSAILASWMFLGGLFPRTDFSHLLHVRALVAHYELHRAEAWALGRSFDLFDFVWLHFIEPDSHVHAQGDLHSELPYYYLGNGTPIFVQEVVQWVLPLREMQLGEKIFSPLLIHSFDYVMECFRPPDPA